MPLTDAKIRSAKATGSLGKLSDGGGLQLWITPAGGKIWKFAFRFEGKQKLLTIGSYPEFSLQEARGAHDAAKKLLARGIDPAAAKQVDKVARAVAGEHTFAKVAAELLEKKRREGKAGNTIGKREWLYGLASDDFGQRPISEITAPEILAVLRRIEAKGMLETAKRLRSSTGEVFRFAIATGRATSDPTRDLKGAIAAPKTKHRAAITDAKTFGQLLRAIDAFKGQPATVAALKLMALLYPRPGELRAAEWKEFDVEGAVWTIPASRMKMRLEHRIPLPRQALAVLEWLRGYTGHAVLAFPGLQDPRRPLSENTMNIALRRMGFSQDDMTSHGFRATASTLLNESGLFSTDAIERSLAHQEKDAVRRTYARGAHWEERVRMGQWWADHLDGLCQTITPDNS